MRAFFFLVVVYVARLVVHLITFLSSKVFWIQKFSVDFYIAHIIGCVRHHTLSMSSLCTKQRLTNKNVFYFCRSLLPLLLLSVAPGRARESDASQHRFSSVSSKVVT